MNTRRILMFAAIAAMIPLTAWAAPAAAPTGAPAALAARTLDLESMLRYALEDERIARTEYEVVLERFPGARPFVNTVRAELTHIGWLEELYQARGLAFPKDVTPRPAAPATLAAAMEVGRQAEIDNIAMYDRFLAQDLPADVRRVFVQLKAASENHLRAFTNNGGRQA